MTTMTVYSKVLAGQLSPSDGAAQFVALQQPPATRIPKWLYFLGVALLFCFFSAVPGPNNNRS